MKLFLCFILAKQRNKKMNQRSIEMKQRKSGMKQRKSKIVLCFIFTRKLGGFLVTLQKVFKVKKSDEKRIYTCHRIFM
jgi:hypothetical protein